MPSYEEDLSEFERRNAQVLGISTDQVFSNEAWAKSMGAQADEEFGHCTLFGECAQVCPEEIPISAVAALNHERLRAWARRYRVLDNAERSKRENHRHGDE